MTDGQFDSAVVEALALAYALHIACEMHTRAEGFTGALVVVDNTNVPAAVFAGYDLPLQLQRSRPLSPLILQFAEVRPILEYLAFLTSPHHGEQAMEFLCRALGIPCNFEATKRSG